MAIRQTIECDRCDKKIEADSFYEVIVKSHALGIDQKFDVCRACGKELLPMIKPGWKPVGAQTTAMDERYERLQDAAEEAGGILGAGKGAGGILGPAGR